MFDFDLHRELEHIQKSQRNSLGLNISWEKSLQNSIRSKEDFENFFEIQLGNSNYCMSLPKRFALKVKKAGKDSALFKQFVPSEAETSKQNGLVDPIGDLAHQKDGKIIHRYKNRALYLATQNCAGICRFCFRKNLLNTNDKLSHFEDSLDYLKRNLDIEELIFSGGDPLLLSDERINYYLERISNETLIRFVRFHTRAVSLLPERITDSLIDILKLRSRSFGKMMFVLHINHPSEIDQEVAGKIKKLQEAGIEILSQTVLLKGINNSKETMIALINKLISLNIRPYYLHHPDKVKGAMHFYVSLEEGRRIYATLRNEVSGSALPQYILDLPGGMGKTNAYNPEGFECSQRFITKDSKIVKFH